MTDEQPTNGNLLTATDVTALVSLMSGMLDGMERRIISRLDDNSRLASERWVKHDQELEANTKRVVDRFLEIERALDAHVLVLTNHLDKEHDQEVAMTARVRPVTSALSWTITHWPQLLLFLFGLLGLLAIAADVFARYLGVPT